MIQDYTDKIHEFWEREGIPRTVEIDGRVYDVNPPGRISIIENDKKRDLFVAQRMIDLSVIEVRNPLAFLATGRTPEGVYKVLTTDKIKEATQMAMRVTIANLDEHFGLIRGTEDYKKLSYAYYIWHHFLQHIRGHIKKHLVPNTAALDPEGEMKRYARKIAETTITHELFGVGPDAKNGLASSAHLAFIEAFAKLTQGAHVVNLDDATKAANHKTNRIKLSEYPPTAGTVGAKEILRALSYTLLATGMSKQHNIADFLTKPFDHQHSVHLLKLRSTQENDHVVLDRAAGQELTRRVT